MRKQKLFFFLIITLIGIQQIKSQITLDYANPKEYYIGDISISGIKYLNHNALIQLSGLKVGQKVKIPGEDITRSLKKLWKQGLFSDIQYSYKDIVGDTIYLDIYLQERPRLSKIVFSGLSNSQIKDMEEKINLKRGKQVTDNVLNNVRNTIRNHFVDKGFYHTEVTTITKNDTTFQNTVLLYINVNKGEKVKIREIAFEGDSVFEEKKLRRYLKDTKQKRWYRIFKTSKYVPSKYKDDKANFVTKLNEKGYRDAKILNDSIVENNEDNTVSLYIKIVEGNKFYFRNIKWVGNTKFSSENLSKALKIKKGDVYDQALLDKRLTTDEDAVGNLYMDDGYLFFNVTPVEMQVVNDSIDLEIRIVEGPQATINKVIITGNTRTNDHVIRREIYTRPGELFSKSDIIRTIRELAQLGHFDPEQIVPTPLPDPSNGTVDLEYSLVEKANDQIELSGGWGAGMIVGTLGLRFNNFSTRNFFDKKAWQPLPTGDGQQLSLRAQTNGKYYQSYSLTFVEPWLGGKKPNSLSVSFYRTIQTGYYSNYGYNNYYGYNNTATSTDRKMKVTGVSVGLGRRLKWPDDYFTLYNEISYRRYDLNNYTLYGTGMDNGTSNQLAFNTVFGRNSVSQPLYPRFGSDFSLGLEFTLPLSMWNGVDYTENNENLEQERYKWLEYYKWTFKAAWYTSIVGDLVLSAKAEYGLVGFYNSDIGPSPFEGYSLGGDGMGYYIYGKTTVGLRGYENGSLTPRDGANMYSKYALELRYPLTLSQSATIYALAFTEAGNGWNSFNQFNPYKLYRSAGVGVRVFLPMLGLLGIDWGYGFDQTPGATGISGSQFHFVLGQQF
jgi:outer membrane protein insertion porin family